MSDHQVQTQEISLRELRLLVAEKVMGYRWRLNHAGTCRALFPSDTTNEYYSAFRLTEGNEPLCLDALREVPDFAGDMNATMKVVDRMYSLGFKFSLLGPDAFLSEGRRNISKWCAEFGKEGEGGEMDESSCGLAWDNRAKVAILCGALKALGALPEGTVIKE